MLPRVSYSAEAPPLTRTHDDDEDTQRREKEEDVLAKLSPGVAGTRGEKDVASSRTRHTWPAGVRYRTVRARFPALTICNCPGFRLQLAIVAADWVRETLISSQPSAIAAGRALPFQTGGNGAAAPTVTTTAPNGPPFSPWAD